VTKSSQIFGCHPFHHGKNPHPNQVGPRVASLVLKFQHHTTP
jgi:hypothetical protein